MYVGGQWRRNPWVEEPLDLGPYSAPVFWAVFNHGSQILTFTTREEAELWVESLPPKLEYVDDLKLRPVDSFPPKDPYYDGGKTVLADRMREVNAWAKKKPIPSYGLDPLSYQGLRNRNIVLARNWLAKHQNSLDLQPALFNRRGSKFTVRREYLVRRRKPQR